MLCAPLSGFQHHQRLFSLTPNPQRYCHSRGKPDYWQTADWKAIPQQNTYVPK